MAKQRIALIQKISKQAVKADWEKAFGGKSYGNRHLFRVAKIAGMLQTKEGGDKFIISIGAWVHDLALSTDIDNNPTLIYEIVSNFLKQFPDLSKDEIEQIAACASAHESGGKKLSLEAKIVHDADVIDKSGMLGIIRHIWKMTNLLEKRELNSQQDLDKLKNHLQTRQTKVFTKTAKKIIEKNNKEVLLFFNDRKFALKTMLEISKMANKGIISDKIAETLLKKYNHPAMRALKEQLILI